MTTIHPRVILPILLGTVLILMGASCSINLNSSKPDGGVFRSADQGKTWVQTVLVSQTPKKTITIGSTSVQGLAFSPIDANSMYAITSDSGLYFTPNGGQAWQQIYNGGVSSLAPDPQRHDVLVVASGNQIYRTADNGTNWQMVYTEATPQISITSVVIAPDNPKVIFAATSQGTVLRSDNEGASWQQMYRMNGAGVSQLVVNPKNPKIMYASLTNGNLMWSGDRGQNWEDVMANLRSQLQVNPGKVHSFALLLSRADALIVANDYGLFRSFDGGLTWENINLVTQPNAVQVVAVGVSAFDERNILYATAQALYRTTDAGKTWQTLSLPAPHPVNTLALSPRDAGVVYLGMGR